MEEAYNPWNVTSLEEFHFYNCPECEEKYAIKEHFIGHAMISHQKARDTLPVILQVQNNIVISNVQSVIEQESCDDVKSDLESSISIEKVEPMSDTKVDENCDSSNIQMNPDDVFDTNTFEFEDPDESKEAIDFIDNEKSCDIASNTKTDENSDTSVEKSNQCLIPRNYWKR